MTWSLTNYCIGFIWSLDRSIVLFVVFLTFCVLKACDLASDWSLVISHHVFLLVACRVACHTVLYFLLYSFHRRLCKWLVTCYWFQCRCTGHLHGRLCRVRGFMEKSCPGRVDTASSSNLGKCLVTCY